MKHLKIALRINTFLIVLFLGCFPRVAYFSQIAYEQAISLKVDSLSLIDKTIEPYNKHEKEVEELLIRVEKTYEYAKHLPNNEYTTQQWEIMKDKNRSLLGGLLNRWKENGQLNPVFVKEAKKSISDAFDTIIELESKKIQK